jgi:hypothetical protein
MNNITLQLKVKERLNKLASNDYDNIECWQVVEAFNKAQIEWVRRQLRGSNLFKDGDEASKRRIDDLQPILTQTDIEVIKKPLYYETSVRIPVNYLEFKRIDIEACTECCEGDRPWVIYLVEEDNIKILLKDTNTKPSFEWAETLCTLISNKIRVYTNGEFEINKAILSYYRFPVYIQIEGCVDPYTTNISTEDIECEFKDDIVELIIDEAVGIIAGDIESGNQFSRNSNNAERNN